jgi:uncharacterized protein (TIGR00369 family)
LKTPLDEKTLEGIAGSPLDDALGLSFAGVEGDVVVLRLVPAEVALGTLEPPVLHGGTLATAVDTAAWFAIVRVSGTRSWVASDLRIDYLRPAALDPLRIEATCVKAGRTLALADVRVVREDDPARIVAVGRGSFARVC